MKRNYCRGAHEGPCRQCQMSHLQYSIHKAIAGLSLQAIPSESDEAGTDLETNRKFFAQKGKG